MKRFFILVTAFTALTFSVSAQGLYFDIGLGVGKAWTKINGVDVMDAFGDGLKETAVDLGLRVGYGPLLGGRLYAVADFGGIGHRIYDDSNYIQFNSYSIGPTAIFYPVPLIQLSAGLGYSYTSNMTDIPGVTFLDSKSGFAWNIGTAFDFGKGNHGLLLGLKFLNAINTIRKSNAEENSAMLGIFVKYRYRHKKS